MNVLVVGTGQGSFEMRGRQIGRALGARVSSAPSDADFQWADVAILVKHAGLAFARQAHRFDVPIVWDVLDCWRQPDDNVWTVEQGKAFIAGLAAKVKPVVMIAATQQMATDIGGVYIPHHCRIGLKPTPPREQVKTVAYDGQKKYIGRWLNAIRAECDRRGWSFVINPPDLTQADILVAFRSGKWDGPLCRAWKSGVKYVNAMSCGRPILTQSTAAREELAVAGPVVEATVGLSAALDECVVARSTAWHFRTYEFDVATIAGWFYRPLLDRVTSEVSCTTA